MSLCTCASHVQVVHGNFYLGLLSESNEEKILMFEGALGSSNEFIRKSAAEELAILMSRGSEISARTMKQVRKEAQGFWADAFEITANINKEKILTFLLGYDLNSASFNAARNIVSP